MLVWLLAALMSVHSAGAQSTQSIGTAAGSGITIQVTNVYNGIPERGYLPLRVSIANTSNADGRWDVVTQAAFSGDINDRRFGAQATCPVPAHVTQVFEVLAPLPTTTAGNLPHVSVHITGPGVTNGDVQFASSVQAPPPSALSKVVPLNPPVSRGRIGMQSTISINTADGSSTRTTTNNLPDGSSTVESVITHADGSTQTTTTTRNPNGAITSSRTSNTPSPRGGAGSAGGAGTMSVQDVRNITSTGGFDH